MEIKTNHFIVKENGLVVETDIEVNTNDTIPEGVVIDFLTEDEIVDDLVGRVLSGEDKHLIKTETTEQLNCLHASLGCFIRNTYGLWLSPHPYSNNGNSSAENFADKISASIIEMLKKRLL